MAEWLRRDLSLAGFLRSNPLLEGLTLWPLATARMENTPDSTNLTFTNFLVLLRGSSITCALLQAAHAFKANLMQKYVSLLIALLSTGCYTCQRPTEPCARLATSTGYMIVNNSGVLLNLVQDGQTIAQRIEPGQVVPLRPVWLRTTSVVAVGYTPVGDYVGADSYTFSSAVRETWIVNALVRPQTSLSR
jgi:hypothetical protein